MKPDPKREAARLTANATIQGVPEHLIEGLVGYIVHRWPTGGYLTAVLRGDLRAAVARGDAQSLAGIVETVHFLEWDAPARCWGSPVAVERWSCGS